MEPLQTYLQGFRFSQTPKGKIVLKKTIRYVDFNGNQQAEDFYFHISKRELVILNLDSRHPDGKAGEWTDLIASGNGGKIMKVMDDLIVSSYGRRSEDGKTFLKKESFLDEFRGHAAYDVLYMELVTNADAASKFFNAIVPADLVKQANAEAQQLKTIDLATEEEQNGEVYRSVAVPPEPPRSAYEQFRQSGRQFPTKAELLKMETHEIAQLMGEKVGREKLGEEGTT